MQSSDINHTSWKCKMHPSSFPLRCNYLFAFFSEAFQVSGMRKDVHWGAVFRRTTSKAKSIAFEERVYESCQSSRTRKAVAEKECLSCSAVKEIFYRRAEAEIKPTGAILTRVLGIYEIFLKKRHKLFVLIISDIEQKCVQAVLPERIEESLESWIDNLSVSQRKAIRYASIDMWSPYYYYAVRKKSPRAKIVVDRFHVMKQLNRRISRIRRKIQRNATDKVKEALKRSRQLFVKNRLEFTEKMVFTQIRDEPYS